VNLLASILRKGEEVSRASRREISVLPTPVGPIMRMFLGAISSARTGGSLRRRKRFRRAMATAFLAAFWPMMYLSSSATISWGVSSAAGVSAGGDSRLSGREMGIQSSSTVISRLV
jgi:hypothetical protein